MWEKPDHRTATAIARPIRVAYLVEVADCPDGLLDAIFAESYSRWGGRRTPIIPATIDGPDERYSDWLQYFDPDIDHSFVALTDASMAAIYEQYAPAYLTQHVDWGLRRGEPRSFGIELPLKALSSLSVLPAFYSRSWDFDGIPTDLRILDKFWIVAKARFSKRILVFRVAVIRME